MKTTIRIAGLYNDSIVDGPGLRFVVFTQGCLFACKNCHNADTWAVNGGYLIEMDEIVSKWRKNKLIDGITLSGGDPLFQSSKSLYLLRKAKETGLNVTVYSGDVYEKLIKDKDPDVVSIINEADYLIDGPYVDKLRDLTLLYRGSSNQRIIDLVKSRKEGKVILFDEHQ